MKSNKIFPRHIVDEINLLIEETEGIEFEEFMKNEVLKRPVREA
jgi:hypothetical protein